MSAPLILFDEAPCPTSSELENLTAELEDLERVNPDCGTVQLDLQRYIGLLSKHISLIKREK